MNEVSHADRPLRSALGGGGGVTAGLERRFELGADRAFDLAPCSVAPRDGERAGLRAWLVSPRVGLTIARGWPSLTDVRSRSSRSRKTHRARPRQVRHRPGHRPGVWVQKTSPGNSLATHPRLWLWV